MTRRLAVALALLASVAPAARATVPCQQVAGVNDKCEAWHAADTGLASYASLAVSPAGDRVFGVGTGNAKMTVTAYDAKRGSISWIGHPATDLTTTGNAVVVSADGKAVYVLGTLSLRPDINSQPYTYFLTMRYDAKTGRALWSALYRGVGANGAGVTAIALSPRGDKVFVTGSSQRPGPYQVLPTDWATVGYDARTGRQLWVTRYAGLAGGQNVPAGVAVSPHGDRVYVTGRSEHPTQNVASQYDIATIGYDARTGKPRWTRRVPGMPIGLVLRADDVWVGGTSATGGGTYLRYAGASGKPVATLANASGALAFTVSPDQRTVYTTTYAVATSAAAAVTTLGIGLTALDAKTGRQSWTLTYGPVGSTYAAPSSIATDAKGARIFVSGVLGPSIQTLYPVTLAVTKQGALSWVARYDLRDPAAGTGASTGRVAVTRDGKHVYTGGLAASSTGIGVTSALLLAYEG